MKTPFEIRCKNKGVFMKKSLLYIVLVILSAVEAAMIGFHSVSGKHDLLIVFYAVLFWGCL